MSISDLENVAKEKAGLPCRRLLSGAGLTDGVEFEGPFRVVQHHGREGLQAQSRWAVAELKEAKHTLNADAGSLTLWVLPMEDLSNATYWGHFRDREPDFWLYTLLSDSHNLRDLGESHFAIVWRTDWWRQLMARFTRTAARTHTTHKPAFGPCDFHFRALHWYQISVTWCRSQSRFRLFVNGICVGHSNRWRELVAEQAGPSLYFGNTCFAIGELSFYGEELSGAGLREIYRHEATGIDEEIDRELRETHGGEGFEPFEFSPGGEYATELELPLTRPEDLAAFYIQGNTQAPRITSEGLLIKTPKEFPPPLMSPDNNDRIQVYLHTWKTFEGDIAVEFDFMPLEHEGLALIMVYASGMQREDFMKDYPLRTIGSMRMVCWENVRNYHWEFWREMEGIRHDVATHAFFKNPWFRGLAYRAMPSLYEPGRWHRLQLVQRGRRWRGAIDGLLVFDVTDDPFANHGPAYSFGHVALRNMWGSNFLWRDLRVSVRPPEFSCRDL